MLTVYPRVCGGTRRPRASSLPRAGLSPRVRGNRPPVHDGHFDERSIPACAGEPRRAARGERRTRVYPRVCGGTEEFARLVKKTPGLSPRVRGNPLRFCG